MLIKYPIVGLRLLKSKTQTKSVRILIQLDEHLENTRHTWYVELSLKKSLRVLVIWELNIIIYNTDIYKIVNASFKIYWI